MHLWAIDFRPSTCSLRVSLYFSLVGGRAFSTFPPLLLLDFIFLSLNFSTEVDYFPPKIKEHYKLWRIDNVLIKSEIPKPFVLPTDFQKLPGPVIYVSLGNVSMMEIYFKRLMSIGHCSILFKDSFKLIQKTDFKLFLKVLCSAGTPTVSKGWSTSSISFLIGTSLVWVRTATRFGCPVRSSSEQTMWINWRCCRLAM